MAIRLVAYTTDGRKFVSEPIEESIEQVIEDAHKKMSEGLIGWLDVDGWILPIRNVTAFKVVDEKEIW